jgi:uncharacterized membrane protein
LLLRYNYKLVDAVQGNKRLLFWELYKTHNYSLRAKLDDFDIREGGINFYLCALKLTLMIKIVLWCCMKKYRFLYAKNNFLKHQLLKTYEDIPATDTMADLTIRSTSIHAYEYSALYNPSYFVKLKSHIDSSAGPGL